MILEVLINDFGEYSSQNSFRADEGSYFCVLRSFCNEFLKMLREFILHNSLNK